MVLTVTGNGIFIVNKKSQKLCGISAEGTTLFFQGEDGVSLEGGVVCVNDIFACLYSLELRNVTFVIKGNEIEKITAILSDTSKFEQVIQLIKDTFPMLDMSEQNRKINGYATSLVEKLKEGVAVTIMGTKEKDEIKYCPECGMQCDPNIPYCMECGAVVS